MQIGSKTIDSISGPVSFVLLKPKMELYKQMKKRNVYLPIVLLFGDVHFSNENECKNCKDKCYKIYSSEFLKIFDSLCGDNFNVNFSLEDFIRKENVNEDFIIKLKLKILEEDKLYPMHRLKTNTIPCYYKDNISKTLYDKYCPYQKMKFLPIDPRQSVNHFETFYEYIIFHIIYELEKILLCSKIYQTELHFNH